MSQEKNPKPYPSWVCHACGDKFGRKKSGIATWHLGKCDVCGNADNVTEPRDFGHLRDGWELAKDA